METRVVVVTCIEGFLSIGPGYSRLLPAAAKTTVLEFQSWTGGFGSGVLGVSPPKTLKSVTAEWITPAPTSDSAITGGASIMYQERNNPRGPQKAISMY